MAADQLNKRSKVNNDIRYTSWEIQKAKKKKYSHYDLNTKSNISLEWDNKKEQVVPNKQQISIASRELIPFLPLNGNNQNVIGDVFTVPPELFELDDLNGLLSFEVWHTYLSAEEREFLTQFLPEGVDPYTTVYELLAGNNFCFGNPFRKWGASVCSDDCHPDSVLRQEQCNKANKIAYYSELHEYHTKMIGTLQLWKEKWEIGMNPENVRLEKTPRSISDINKSGPSIENGIQYGHEDDLVATSDYFSSDADAKSYTSISPQLAITNGETSKRVSKTYSGSNYYDSSGGKSTKRPKKKDKVSRQNIECGNDGAKYMSYIKVSKEQHERVKSSMKHSNTSIQPKSLNHVLGNLDSFRVQPYKVFEEEERQKLHDYWLHLAKKDVPAGFENWNSWRSAKLQLTKSLRKEIEDKFMSNDSPAMDLCNQDKGFVIGGQDEAQSQSQSQSQSQAISNPFHEQQVDEGTNGVRLIVSEENIEQNGDSVFQSEAELNASNHEITAESTHDSDQNQRLPHITMHNDTQNVCPMAIDSNNDALIESTAFPSTLVQYTENVNHTVASIGEPFHVNHAVASIGEPLPPLSSASEIWPPVSLPPNVYYNQPPTVTHGYPSISELSLRQGQPGFFNPYVNQDRDELLLHSLYKDPGSSLYHHEQKLSSLRFHPSGNDSILGTSQFPRNISSSLPLNPRHEFRENLFTIPRQEHLLPLNHFQDWSVNGGGINLPMPASSHQQLSQNWFSADEVSRVGWSGGVIPNQELGNSGQVSDESLFSVLSQCQALRQGVHYGSTSAMDQFIQPGNYLGVGRGQPTATNTVPPRDARGPALNYTSGNEAQLGWMNLPGGKPFPRLWNEKDIG